MVKRNVIDFNFVDEMLEEHGKNFLIELCKNYHWKAWIYKQIYKHKRKYFNASRVLAILFSSTDEKIPGILISG